MLKSLFVMAFAVFAFALPASAMKPLADNSKPTVVVFYADWCGSCKILDPKMMEAMGQIDNKDALEIITFDFSNDETKAKSAALAATHGLTDLYQKHVPKTGFVVLLNKSGHNPMTLTKADSVEVIKAKLETFIATQS